MISKHQDHSSLDLACEGISFCGRFLQQSILRGKDLPEAEIKEVASALRTWLGQLPRDVRPLKVLQIRVLEGLCNLLLDRASEEGGDLDLAWALGSSQREERILAVLYLLCWEKVSASMLSSMHLAMSERTRPTEFVPLLSLEDWLAAHLRSLYIGQIPDLDISRQSLEVITEQEIDMTPGDHENVGFRVLLLGLLHVSTTKILAIRKHRGMISFVARE
jgi:hypothetical protein